MPCVPADAERGPNSLAKTARAARAARLSGEFILGGDERDSRAKLSNASSGHPLVLVAVAGTAAKRARAHGGPRES